jgi:TPR repeat protein
VTTILTTHSVSFFIAGVVSLLTSACATGDLLSNRVDVAGVRYDAQECVENALRNRPDPAATSDAAVAFARACQEGEAASCSVLGVMYELGRGFAVDTLHARALYGGACETHNLRACGNLGELLLSDGSRARESGRAVSLLRMSCNGGEERACDRLGRAYRDGDGEPRDSTRATALFNAACGAGYAPACVELAAQSALSGERGVPSGAQALELSGAM